MGSISIFLFILIIQLVWVSPYFWFQRWLRDYEDPENKAVEYFEGKCMQSRSDISNTWIRFILEIYLELLIGCLVGWRLTFLVEEKTNADIFALVLTFFFFVVIVVFPIYLAIVTIKLVRQASRVMLAQRKIMANEVLEYFCDDFSQISDVLPELSK